MYVFAHLGSPTTTEKAWDAVYQDAKNKNFGTSQQDIDSYAAAGSSVAAGAACVAAGAPVAAPLCAELGGIIGGAVADFIQNVGAALFGSGGDIGPSYIDVANQRASAMVAAIVTAVNKQRGNAGATNDTSDPLWAPTAAAFARNVNALFAPTVPSVALSVSPSLRQPFSTSAKITDAFVAQVSDLDMAKLQASPTEGVQPTYYNEAMSSQVLFGLWPAMLTGAQQTTATSLSSGSADSGSGSAASALVKVGVGGALVYGALKLVGWL